ncbi:MAG: iron-sulfur cluster assembly scaffold protein [Gammaproteobacteria bacterium]|nr:iron-sulfur cluster assembly scaffold protein [Gammaproteobacteria bacterium]MDH3430260.1 iron-sulfur cluster assembly scaffold protein [Gammaproteobacteria bacterium]MDH3433003.1 iron-sulfur cluster assembly scaffold protein [Gammaproteobacteria bacterium]
MSNDPYSARVRELFDAPAHAGCLGGELCAKVEDQGVRICLCAEPEGGEIRRMRFLAWGCPHVIAAAEAVCAYYEGRSSAELLDFSALDLMQSLSVPVEKTGRILVIEDAVRTLGGIVRDASNLDN